MTTGKPQSIVDGVQATELPDLAKPQRYPSIDIARGVIIVVMALDHASSAWNAGRPYPCLEGWVVFPTFAYASIWQQITREITHICAPGFQLLAGMGLAISVFRRRGRGTSEFSISGDIILRGLALVACEFVVMYWPYGRIPFAFIVLACIGCNMILFSVLRKLPIGVIGLASVAVIVTAPLYAQTTFVEARPDNYAVNILTNVAIAVGPPFPYMVIYPLLPWIGCFGLGWCLGELYERGAVRRARWVVAIGAACIVAAFFLRWFGGTNADRLPVGGGPWSLDFWIIAKYPPSIVFLLSMLGANLVLIGLLRPLDHRGTLSSVGSFFATYGRVALFFFIAHFYLYYSYPALTGTKSTYGLPTTYAAWLTGVVLLFFPCVWYHKLRVRYRTVLRYL